MGHATITMTRFVHWSAQLAFVFAMVVVSFIAATAITQWRVSAIDRSALEIAENAAPSIERLAVARGEIHRLQLLLDDRIDVVRDGGRFDAKPIEDSRRKIDGSIDAYRSLATFPGEQALWAEIVSGHIALNAALDRCISEAERGDFRAASATLGQDVAKSADELGNAFSRDIEFNAEESRKLALRIRWIRSRSMSVAVGLNVVCALVTIAGAITLRRAMNAHADLAERHRRLLQEQATELEAFAGRVAHDILSPLGTVALTLELASRGDVVDKARFVERGTNALQRVKRLVNDLLAFARAGAKPEPDAHTEVGATITEVITDLQSAAAEADVELDVRGDLACEVACSPGVLTSLITNLTGNAIKYIGDGPNRRIELRVLAKGEAVRVEVEDTGLGLPPDLEEHVFEPYVRGRMTTQPGIGLGLATVKRMAEAHRGCVGVRSIPGQGCTFWFELPKATPARGTSPLPKPVTLVGA